MASLNNVSVIGHLGRDPEMRYTPAGNAVTTFSVAATRSWKAQGSEAWSEETTWFKVTCWGPLAERVAEHQRKGMQVYVSGRIRTFEWDNASGVKQRGWEVVADKVFGLGKRDDKGHPADGYVDEQAGGPSEPAPAVREAAEAIDLDDLPF